jgi:hypothetical protein
MTGGKTHYPSGGKKAPRPTTLIEVKDLKLTTKKVDGEVKANPQPY